MEKNVAITYAEKISPPSMPCERTICRTLKKF
jgi:hypothetical protein